MLDLGLWTYGVGMEICLGSRPLSYALLHPFFIILHLLCFFCLLVSVHTLPSSPLVLFIMKFRLNLGGNAKNAKLVKKNVEMIGGLQQERQGGQLCSVY